MDIIKEDGGSMSGPLEVCSCCMGRGYHLRANVGRKSVSDPMQVKVVCSRCCGRGTYRSDAA